jgi:hypothetical protein
VVVIDADAPAAKPERRRFTTMPSELCRLSTWLKEHGVEEAVMESTAQYWRPVWLELEPYIRLHLAQAISNPEGPLPRTGQTKKIRTRNMPAPKIILNDKDLRIPQKLSFSQVRDREGQQGNTPRLCA